MQHIIGFLNHNYFLRRA